MLLIFFIIGACVAVLAIPPAVMMFIAVSQFAKKAPERVQAVAGIKSLVRLAPFWIAAPGSLILAFSGLLAPHGGGQVDDPGVVVLVIGAGVTVVASAACGIFLNSPLGLVAPLAGYAGMVCCVVPASQRTAQWLEIYNEEFHTTSLELFAALAAPYVWVVLTVGAMYFVWRRTGRTEAQAAALTTQASDVPG